MSKSKHITDFRIRRKKALVEACGNKCQICGNQYPYDIYEFHHINSNEKETTISNSSNVTKNKLINEVKKCILVCPNCHRILEFKSLTFHTKLRKKRYETT